jgi:uncharacterized membrane protein YkvA (DUF1232 family)
MIPVIMMKRLKYLRYFFQYLSDRQVPWFRKLWFYLVILYFVSPIDLLPDLLIPGLGWLDDLLIILWSVFKLLQALEGYAITQGDGPADPNSKVIYIKKYKYRSRP